MDDTMKTLLHRASCSPEDYITLLVAADRACECGYTSLERVLRWMGHHRKWPVSGPFAPRLPNFCWQHQDAADEQFPSRSLPRRLCSRMGIAPTQASANYTSFFVAIAVLALALELEPEEN